VFASAHGDLAVTDALCRSLAEDPLALSPTRFHHSVHNTASGYWAMASACRAASSAVAGGEHSFAAGLLEAAALAVSDNTPVLLVAYDTEALGPLHSVNDSRGLLSLALVLSPWPGPATRWQVTLTIGTRQVPMAATPSLEPLGNACSNALPLFQALATAEPAVVHLALNDGLGLRLNTRTWSP
jgi:hypothetical protein